MQKGLNYFKENPNGESLREGWQTLVPKDIKLQYAKEDTAKENPSFVIEFLNTGTKVVHSEWLRTDGTQNWKWIQLASIYKFEAFEDGTPDENVLTMLEEKMLGEPIDVEVKKNTGKNRAGAEQVYTNIMSFAESGTKATEEEEEEKKPVNHSKPEKSEVKKTKW